MRSRDLPPGRSPVWRTLLPSALGWLALFPVVVLTSAATPAVSPRSAGVQLLALGAAPVITLPPRSQALVVNLSAILEVVAGGEPPLTYVWSKDGTELVSATNLLEVTNARLTFAPFLTNDAGGYTVTVSNRFGSVTSELARLTLLPNPSILQHPESQIVIDGATVGLSVVAEGSSPLSYLWFKDGVQVPELTGTALIFVPIMTNNAGVYQVVVSNTVGTATSEPATLVVKPNTPRQLRAVDLVQSGPTQARVPVEFAAQGDERQLGFSLHFNPDVLQNPVVALTAAAEGLLPSAQLEVNDLEAAQGRLGVSLTLAPGDRMPAQTFPLVDVDFLVASPFWPQASLTFAAVPVPLGATGGDDLALPVLDLVVPVWRAVALPPTPDLQSGLFEQRLRLVNVSADPYPGVEVLVHGLTNDTLGRPLRLANASGATNGVPLAYYGPLFPGEEVELTLAYYVADRRTLPTPDYEVRTVPARQFTAPSGLAFAISRVQFVENRSLIEFLTMAGRRYYVQYVDELGSTAWRTAVPEILGTGARVQWIDDGPPKTTRRPTSQSSRFYRGLLLP